MLNLSWLQWVLAVAVWMMAATGNVLADGKVFSTAKIVPSTPDQRALLYYSNGLERLVIETSFEGEGTNFAWVVPLPSVPVIEAASANLFPVLMDSFRPVLITDGPYSILQCLIGVPIVVFIWLKRRSKLSSPAIIVLALLLIFFGGAVAIPNFVKSRGESPVPNVAGVQVVKQARIGAFETSVIKSQDGNALQSYLNTNGFYLPEAALPVIRHYVSNGWVFVASRLSRPGSWHSRGDLHPLSFTFATTNPVYPLKLTGIDDRRCEVELVVFGPARAHVKGFDVQYCGRPQFTNNVSVDGVVNTDYDWFRAPKAGAYLYSFKEIHQFASPSEVVTKLSGRLTSDQMANDAWVSWVPFKKELPRVYSYQAAGCLFLDWLLGLGFLATILLLYFMKSLGEIRFWKFLFIAWAVSFVIGAWQYLRLEIVEIERNRAPWHAAYEYKLFIGAVASYAWDRDHSLKAGTNELPVTFENMMTALTNEYHRGVMENTFTREPMRNEASSGNIQLKTTASGTDVIWYDRWSMPHKVFVIPDDKTNSAK